MNDLVVQGPDASLERACALQSLTGARSLERLGDAAFRLIVVGDTSGVIAYCASLAIDHAVVRSDRRLSDFKLLAMDMDSTLITIECIDELADMIGVKPQVAAITAAAMRGEMDFQESLRRRVVLLAGLDARALERVYDERLQLSPGAEKMLAKVQSLGIKTLLVSGGFDFFTQRLARRLSIDYTRSNTLDIVAGKLSGQLVGPVLDSAGKAAALREARDRLGIDTAHIIVIGDGANDLPMMAEAQVSIAYHAKPVVQERATYAFNYVGLDGLLNLFR